MCIQRVSRVKYRGGSSFINSFMILSEALGFDKLLGGYLWYCERLHHLYSPLQYYVYTYVSGKVVPDDG